MTFVVPAQMRLPSINFNLSPSSIRSITEASIMAAKTSLDRLASLPQDERSLHTVIGSFSSIDRQIGQNLAASSFLQYVHPDEEVRKASSDCSKLLSQYSIDRDSREDLFKVLKDAIAASSNQMIEVPETSIEKEDARFAKELLTRYRFNGLDLQEADRLKLKEHLKRLSDLEVDFSNALNEENEHLLFSEDELRGVPQDHLSSLKRDPETNNYILSLKYPDVMAVLKKCRIRETRKKMDKHFNSRCKKENLPLIHEAIHLRLKIARLLSFPSHAMAQLGRGDRMVEDAAKIVAFENDLKDRLTPLAEKELARLKELMEKDDIKDTFMGYDFGFYTQILLEQQFSIDHEVIKEYFEANRTIAEMLRIYEEVLSLKITPLTNAAKNESIIPVWHDSVTCYEVRDAKSDDSNDNNNNFIGHLYMDLYPRAGKYGHAACFTLLPGSLIAGQTPIIAMVANFSPPTPTSLLKHDEVVTLFHELGHAMHALCSKTHHSHFHGTNVETDFVEAPSQMLENWCWDPAVLGRLGQHWERAGERIPSQMIDSLVASKRFQAGLTNLRQIFFGLYDLRIHGSSVEEDFLKPEDMDRVYEEMRLSVTLIPQAPHLSPISSFGHMMGGYDAGYYGYMWSQVFSADMFFSCFAGKLSPAAKKDLQNTGQRYRNEILLPGGSRPGMESLKAFLGREPTSEAFARSIGI